MPRRRPVARLERLALVGIGDVFAEAAAAAGSAVDEGGAAAAARRLQETLLDSIPHYFHREILSECLVITLKWMCWAIGH